MSEAVKSHGTAALIATGVIVRPMPIMRASITLTSLRTVLNESERSSPRALPIAPLSGRDIPVTPQAMPLARGPRLER